MDAAAKEFACTVGYETVCEPLYKAGKDDDGDKCTANFREKCCDLFNSYRGCPFYTVDWFMYTCIGLLALILFGIVISIICCCCKKGRGGGGKDQNDQKDQEASEDGEEA